MGNTLVPLLVCGIALVVLIGMWRSVMSRYRTTTNQASEVFERYKKAEVRDERRLALSEEMLALQRETNDMLRRLLEKS
jgi:hypothetical protein